MSERKSKRLVIDACVVRAAGDKEQGISSKCRRFLDETLRICDRMVMTPKLRQEWNKHQSLFATKWRASMIARKKMVPIQDSGDVTLLIEVQDAAESGAGRREMTKDIHLMEAALATDHIVVTIERDSFARFERIKAKVPRLAGVQVFNPTSGKPL
ncbi:MAG: hypothetical protein IT167_27945 [Bryobacterales bacterium]|nr:hypothetical protein [Bryobacterales bacterium]